MPPAARYSIRKKLGEGGMAEVLEAVAQGDEGFTRRVAIKRLLPSHAADASFARMFLDEARIVSRLHHGGIVAVLDYGVVDGAPFQILEFVDGQDARTLVHRGRDRDAAMPLEVALYLVTEIARALHYAHEEGVVHRDVKPANILVSHAGDVKLADFGIAFASERTERTQAGVAKGTPGYMAPEQVFGGGIDARADIFALGCVLHALVTGDSPLSRAGNLEHIMQKEPIELASGLPEDIEAIIRHATFATPSQRYATARAMAEDTGAALASRLKTDAKGALLAWLERVRETAKPASAFDALLMPEALLENDGGSWRLETTKLESLDVAKQPPPAPRRRSFLLWVALAFVSVLAIGVGSRFARGHEHAPTVATTSSTSTTASTEAPSETTSFVSPIVATAPSIETPRHSTHSAPATASIAPPSNVNGTLAVRGGAYRGAVVVIDGHVAPFGAPHYFDLPLGKHRVAIRADGGVLAEGNVDIHADHTSTAPLFWP